MLLSLVDMTDLELELVTGGTPTLAQCFATSHAAWLPGAGGGAIVGYGASATFKRLRNVPGKSAAVGAIGGFALGVAGGCWNAANGDYP